MSGRADVLVPLAVTAVVFLISHGYVAAAESLLAIHVNAGRLYGLKVFPTGTSAATFAAWEQPIRDANNPQSRSTGAGPVASGVKHPDRFNPGLG